MATLNALPVEQQVYGIRLTDNLHKMGYSKEPQRRVKSAKTFSGEQARLICAAPVANARLAEKRALHLLGSRGRNAGHEVVGKSEEEVMHAIRLVTGREVLTPHQIGARLWNTEYKGKTIGRWAEASWHDATVAVPTLFKSEGLKILAELGLLVMFSQRYLHFMHLHKLVKALPEFGLWLGTLSTWEGIEPKGTPRLNEKKRTTVTLSVVKNEV